MRCPYCTYAESKVTDSRVVENGIRRRRECQRCGLRFTTYERIQATALMVSKEDNRREEFNREKLSWVPRKIVEIEEIPCLASGKLDLKAIEKLAQD